MNELEFGRNREDELDGLLTDLFETGLSDPGFEALLRLLANGTARRRYVEYASTHALLQWRSGSVHLSLNGESPPRHNDLNNAMVMDAILEEGQPAQAEQPERTFEGDALPVVGSAMPAQSALPQRRSRIRWWIGVAAVVVAAGGLGLLLTMRPSESAGQSVATLNDAESARWDGSQPALGHAIAQGEELSLNSGWADLRLNRGVDVTVEGPAKFSIASADAIELHSGKLAAIVRNSPKGVVITTPQAVIKDIGTEFGVQCDESGQTIVEVLKGHVEVSRINSTVAPMVLKTGQGAIVSANAISPRPESVAATPFVLNPGSDRLPLGFNDADVGRADISGSAHYRFDEDSWVVSGSGESLAGSNDQFNLASRWMDGGATIVARLTLSSSAKSDSNKASAESGVMIRESTNSDAPFVDIVYNRRSGLQMMHRDSPGQTAQTVAGSTVHADVPVWLKLSRSGDKFTGYYSIGGTSWQLIGIQTVQMTSRAMAGLAVSSGRSGRGTAKFSDVSISEAGTP